MMTCLQVIEHVEHDYAKNQTKYSIICNRNHSLVILILSLLCTTELKLESFRKIEIDGINNVLTAQHKCPIV